MPPISSARFLVPALVALAIPALSAAQAKTTDTMFMKTNVGSFKILGVEKTPASGKMQISFTGTMLIDRFTASDPTITVSSGLRKEYDSAKHLQVAYHGSGTMTIDGHFTAIQWFGRDMSAQWNGFGIARLVGEFDKNLETGKYWYIDNTNDVRDWGTQLREVTNPPQPGTVIAIPTPRVKPPR